MKILKFAVIVAFGLAANMLAAQTQSDEAWHQADRQLIDEALALPDRPAEGRPLQAGVLNPLQIDLTAPRFVEERTNETVISRFRFAAPRSGGLTVYYDDLTLQPGAGLRMTNADGSQVLGPYTQSDNPSGGTFATGILTDDSLVLELRQPASAPASRCLISAISLIKPFNAKDFGGAGACEVNINCSEGVNWQTQKRGVVRLYIKANGTPYWCTGSLINNTRNDRIPYILTANHCGVDATATDLTQWLISFNFETDGCDNPLEAPAKTDLTGVDKVAQSGETSTVGSDFYLVKLKQTIPSGTNAYFNGWSLSADPAPSGVTIHHPQGDIKKISTFTTPLVNSNWNGTPLGTHWQVRWAATETNHGVTEGGSSGSPLFNADGLLIGQLTGGQSACSTPTEPDYYGKLSYSWKTNLNATNQLAAWLDPDNTGVTMLGGLPLAIESPTLAVPFRVFPNPASGTCQVVISDLENSAFEGLLTDITGRTVLTIPLQPGTNTLNLSTIKPGLYLLTLQSGNEKRGSIRLAVHN